MKIKPRTVIIAVIGVILLFYAYKMENDAYDQCIEVLPHNECVRIFG
jgi:hypothetical protein